MKWSSHHDLAPLNEDPQELLQLNNLESTHFKRRIIKYEIALRTIELSALCLSAAANKGDQETTDTPEGARRWPDLLSDPSLLLLCA